MYGNERTYGELSTSPMIVQTWLQSSNAVLGDLYRKTYNIRCYNRAKEPDVEARWVRERVCAVWPWLGEAKLLKG